MEMDETEEAVPGRTKSRFDRRVCGELEVEVEEGAGSEKETRATGELEEMKARV